MTRPDRFADVLPEITAWRREFHAHPELLYDLPRTAGRVAGLLRGFGCDEVVEGIGRSGVVGLIRGRSTGSGRVIGLRADMDALPIDEETGAPWASVAPGRMHACGHDGHTAMLLGAARHLAETRGFDGTVALIFQPAEEGGAGAREMLRDGLLDRFGIHEVYGLHNMPGLPVGRFAIREGAIMAAADQFDITVTGKGGHAAKPHLCVDAVLVAAQIVVALQTIAARVVDPLRPVVVSVCMVESASRAHNVLPQEVRMRGTARTMDPAVQDLVERRITEIVTGVAAAHGARAEVAYRRGYPVTVNAADPARWAAEVAQAVAGPVALAEPMMGAEDFSFLLNERPGAFIFLGNGDSAALHHPAYDFNDEAIPAGAAWLAGMAEARMPL